MSLPEIVKLASFVKVELNYVPIKVFMFVANPFSVGKGELSKTDSFLQNIRKEASSTRLNDATSATGLHVGLKMGR